MFYNFFFFIYFSLFSVSSCSPFVPFCFYLFLIFLCFRFLCFFPCSLLSFFVSVNFVFNHLVWLLGYFALVVLLLSDFSVFKSSSISCPLYFEFVERLGATLWVKMESCVACSVMDVQSCRLCCFHTSSTLWAASRAWWGMYKPEQDSMVFTARVLSLLHVWRKPSPKKKLDQRTK